MRLQFTEKETNRRKRGSAPLAMTPQSIKGKKLFTFLFFLLVSSVWWGITSLQMTYTQTIRIPLNYLSLNEFSVQGTLPKFLDVEIEGTGFELLFDYTFLAIDPIDIKISQGDEALKKHFFVSNAVLKQWVEKQIDPSTKIRTIFPSEISVHLARLHMKEVPIQSEIETVPQGGFLVTQIALEPSFIKVYGSKTSLDSVNIVKTEKVRIEQKGDKTNTSAQVKLEQLPHVRLETHQIKALITFEELTENNFELDIKVKNLPEGYRLRLLPSKANLRITLPKSLYTTVSEKDFSLFVDYGQLQKEAWDDQEQMLPIFIEEPPLWLTRYTLTPARIQYILEKDTDGTE